MPAWPEFDHVIVGGGSAGCVLANRLSADPSLRVLLLEAGPPDRGWQIHMPAALTYNLMNDRLNWYYTTEPQPHLDERRLYWPRGRVLGGSSSLNAMVYIRGHALDYDRWVEEGAAGWSYAEVLPYFKRAETFSGGGDAYRGDSGPLHVTRGATPNPLFDAWIEAGAQAGYPPTDDLNGYRQEGMGRMDMTIHRGRRWSTAQAYLRPVRRRPNLFVPHGLPRDPHPAGAGPGRRRRVCRGRLRQAGAGRARGDPGRRCDQLAAAADAVRDRPGRRARGGGRGRDP